jgi:hypothetical protein
MSRQAIYVRLGALALALAIAFAVVWSYGMTATIIGAYLSHSRAPATSQAAAPGVVTVSVLPASPKKGTTAPAMGKGR